MFTIFIYSLAGGMLAVTATGRPDQIAWRFLRLVGCLVLAMVSLVTVWSIVHGGAVVSGRAAWSLRLGMVAAAAAVTVVLAAPFAASLSRVFRGVCAFGGACGIGAGVLPCLGLLGDAPRHVTVLMLLVAAQTLSALFVGSITVAWLLGHAYLTATRMTIAPLDHFGRVLGWMVGTRLVFVLGSLALALLLGGTGESSVARHLAESWMVALLRIGVGLGAVAVFAYMVRACIRLRATQSATGILYFGSVFAYVGELANQYLIAQCGWPI
jgi:hypothetical protein